MNRAIIGIFIIVSLLFTYSTPAISQYPYQYLIQTTQGDCKHGLKEQPHGGPFSVFAFCGGAIGTDIGIILTEPGGMAGSLNTKQTEFWKKWKKYDRFWQDRIWSSHVINFSWSPSLRYLYVATSNIYGDGGFFKLDLANRTYKKLFPEITAPYMERIKNTAYIIEIETVDTRNKEIKIAIKLNDTQMTRVAEITLPLE